MMINAFFDGSVLKIYVNGNFAFCNDYYAYESRQVIVNGNTVIVNLQTSSGNRSATLFEYDEQGRQISIRALEV